MSLIDELHKTIEGLLAEKVVDEDIEYFEEYKKITGVTDKQIDDFESDFSISLPTDFKAFYKLKDGSGYPLNLLYTIAMKAYRMFCTLLKMRTAQYVQRYDNVEDIAG